MWVVGIFPAFQCLAHGIECMADGIQILGRVKCRFLQMIKQTLALISNHPYAATSCSCRTLIVEVKE